MKIQRIFQFLMSVCFLATAVNLPSIAQTATLPPAIQPEINHLLGLIEQSHCEFFRNGTWYTDGKAIREHAERKLRYFLEKGKIKTTEDCIVWAGTRSEISGQPYRVRCGSNPPEPTAAWLTREIDKYRKETGSR
jgi:hypothetical protein